MTTQQNHPESLVSVQTADQSDVATLYALSLRAFETDKHTLFKLHEKRLQPDDLAQEMPNELEGLFDEDGHGETKGLLLKAVRTDTEEIVGMSGWRWWNRYGEKGEVSPCSTTQMQGFT